ncbi:MULTISPECIES: ArsR/SmtB family transcription factor [unclassified Streptomyces]|uniref:ArsR/SmtB family transcription factor n=1 Tax=unclassified Streptomyces TaxID=2593676 RepID=UPI002259F491|nr:MULTISPECIES: helix-turn-helix transcriptional regulator [unclassified Streptomyces]MCX4627010.1 ArsR family transcriptional regulator [Streptomyces sp. NBC_01443]WSW43166.1 ArsR family transcriptional regulator [Streptomyces sp. NBC_01001]
MPIASKPHGDQLNRQPDIARTAALIADPSRARILKSLSDGRALSAKMLAAEAGVGAPTASVHLAKLVEAGLITVESIGRSRYYRLVGPEVSLALEALAVIAPPLPITTLRESSSANALRRSRTCYDHLAGQLGVALMGALLDHGILTGHDGTHRQAEAVRDQASGYGHDRDYRLTPAGRDALSRFGVEVAGLPGRRRLVRYCVDWSEQQHHLAGAVGAAITARLFQLDWLRYGVSPRVVHLTDAGVGGVAEWLGLQLDG